MSARASRDICIAHSGTNLERYYGNDDSDFRILKGAWVLDSNGKFKLALVLRKDRLHKIQHAGRMLAKSNTDQVHCAVFSKA